MSRKRCKLGAFGAAVVCGAMLATTAAAAVVPPESARSLDATGRRPERTSTRATSLEWMPDVYQRLQVLEDHAAQPASAPLRLQLDSSPLGRLHPGPPAAGDGARP